MRRCYTTIVVDWLVPLFCMPDCSITGPRSRPIPQRAPLVDVAFNLTATKQSRLRERLWPPTINAEESASCQSSHHHSHRDIQLLYVYSTFPATRAAEIFSYRCMVGYPQYVVKKDWQVKKRKVENLQELTPP